MPPLLWFLFSAAGPFCPVKARAEACISSKKAGASKKTHGRAPPTAPYFSLINLTAGFRLFSFPKPLNFNWENSWIPRPFSIPQNTSTQRWFYFIKLVKTNLYRIFHKILLQTKLLPHSYSLIFHHYYNFYHFLFDRKGKIWYLIFVRN